MAVNDNEVKDKARSLGSGKRPSSELDNWLRDNGATASQGNLAGREYSKAYDAATSNTQTSSTKNTKRSLTNPIDVAKAMATGVSPKSEMGSGFKVDMEGLTNYKTAASALQNEIFKQL